MWKPSQRDIEAATNQAIEEFAAFTPARFRSTPFYQLILMLRSEMLDAGFSLDMAARLIAAMEIDGSKDVGDHPDLALKVIRAGVGLMRMAYDTLEADFPGQGEVLLLSMAKSIELEF